MCRDVILSKKDYIKVIHFGNTIGLQFCLELSGVVDSPLAVGCSCVPLVD